MSGWPVRTDPRGAMVARELGVPCVINTRTGARRLRTGDLLRVDGDRGVVTVLESNGHDTA